MRSKTWRTFALTVFLLICSVSGIGSMGFDSALIPGPMKTSLGSQNDPHG